MNNAALLSSYFQDSLPEAELPPYFTLGARIPPAGTAAMDSSDQAVVTFDEVTGVAACRCGVNLVGRDQEVVWRKLGEIKYVVANPTASVDQRLRGKLTLEQSLRLLSGRRPHYFSLRSGPPMIAPRLLAAIVRIAEDYHRLQRFANSMYALPGMLFLADGRLNAQNFPGPTAIDLQGRLLRARGVRLVGLAKDGMLVSVVRPEARAIRRRIGSSPFAFPILKRHLLHAYPGTSGQRAKTLQHGASSRAFGGIGAVRFALSLAGDHLAIVEMNLYDFECFAGLVVTGERLESYLGRLRGLEGASRRGPPPVYSWDVTPFVTECDWERHIVPTLEDIVFNAYTDTELGIYPRALADIHNHVKLRFSDPELEAERRQIIADLARQGVPIEEIRISPEGPHKTDPEEFDGYIG
ncbi:MAG TPA: hypothetical protein VLA19_25525 [Herpetosiphonaceae bacterium]|nr:hypothetical protein [Herpetosiphonaceae bacterium]